MKNILWGNRSAVATQMESGEWIILSDNEQLIVSNDEFRAEQDRVSEEMCAAYEDAYANGEMDELDEEDTYDYLNCFVNEK